MFILYRPLIPVTPALIGGIILGVCCPGYIRLAGAFLFAGATACCVLALRRCSALIAPLVLFFCLGYFSIQPWIGDQLPANHIRHFTGQGKWHVKGSVADTPLVIQDGRGRFVLHAKALSQDGSDQTVCGDIQVTVRGDLSDLTRGDKIEITGYLNAIRNFYNPGGFDYEQFMALKGIRVQMYAKREDIRILSSESYRHWRSWLDDQRRLIGTQMDHALAGNAPDVSALLKAVTIGDRKDMTYALRDQFACAGVGHVMAISGLHIGMVAAAVFFVSVRLLSWIPAMLSLAWTRKAAALFSLIAVGMYALLAGLSPSTQRAAIMAAMLLLALYWIGRRHDWFNAVAVAAFVIGVIHPPAVLSVSFQLSFCAVLAILAGAQWLAVDASAVEQGIVKRWLRRIGVSMWISVLATAGTLPLVMMYFNQVSAVGVAANLVVVPLLGWMVIPLGLSGVAVYGVSPALAHTCWHLSGFGLKAILAVVAWFARQPFAAFHTVTPTLLEVVLYYGCLILVLNWKKISRPGLVLATIMVVVVADAGYWYYQRFGCRDLRVTVLDVGQGSANLLQLPGGRTVLVDGGGFSDRSTFDVGRSLVAPYLWRLKIRTIDLVVLTHPNSDHLNGLIYILDHFHVPAVWSNHEASGTQGYQKWMETIRENRIIHPPFGQLSRKQTISGVLFEILSPEPDFLQHGFLASRPDENENSLVLRVSLGEVSFLFCGDIGRRTEKRLAGAWDNTYLQSTVLMVPHHGSRYSGSSGFLRAVNPEQAVISAGWKNRYRFPHPDVLKRLAAISCRVWRTDLCGAVRITTDGTGYSVKTVLSSP